MTNYLQTINFVLCLCLYVSTLWVCFKKLLISLYVSVLGYRENSNVHVISRVMNISIERDSNGSLGITLRGGAQPDPNLSRPLTITQIKPGGAADR